jgi:PIN domain nuclease of toxin-antitoxin system
MNNSGLLLDTHVWIWLMLGDKLSLKNQTLIEEHASSGRIFLSSISLWEVSMLAAKNKIHLDRPCNEWIDAALKEPKINVITLTPAIAVESAYLPGEFHGDPADRIIVATARIEILTLLTKDEKILSYSKNKYLNAIAV